MNKTCVKCGKEKSTAEFRRDKSHKDGLRSECKDCSKVQYKQTYDKSYGVKHRQHCRDRHRKTMALIIEYKNAHPCVVCNESDESCLDFHHLDPMQKDFNVSTHTAMSWPRILAEIAKCIVVCSNCHRKLHAGKITISAHAR